MTTLYQFTPSPVGPYIFYPTLDGGSYTASIIWSVFGQRWMFNLNSPSGALIVSRALVGSPDGTNIQNLSWANGRVTVTTDRQHPFLVMGTFPLTIQEVTPDTYNGTKLCFVLSSTEVWYDASEDPGKVSAYGHIHSQLNLVSGYFTESTLVYRSSSRQFEVNP